MVWAGGMPSSVQVCVWENVCMHTCVSWIVKPHEARPGRRDGSCLTAGAVDLRERQEL